MPQSQCLSIALKAGETETFLAWVERSRTERREDMLRILRLEGMVAETMCLDRSAEGDRLILYTSAEDLAHAARVMEESNHPFDVETREVIARTWDLKDVRPLTILFEAVGSFQ